MDESTRVTLQKAINNGMVESFGGIVATGKEAVVIHATGGQTTEELQEPIPGELAVKVFKTTLNEFKNRQDYIANDYRNELENESFSLFSFFSVKKIDFERVQKVQRSLQKDESSQDYSNVVWKRAV